MIWLLLSAIFFALIVIGVIVLTIRANRMETRLREIDRREENHLLRPDKQEQRD